MNETLEFMIRYGYLVLFGFIFAEQIGVPLPSLPILLAAGALSRTGQMNPWMAMLVSVTAAAVSDLIWYELGRRRGGTVLGWLCRIAVEPDSCVRRTETMFARHGIRSLLIAKFVPGLNTVAPPLAGMLRMRRHRFLLFDLLGAGLWVGLFTGLGYAFSEQIGEAARWTAHLGLLMITVLVVPLGGYLAWKVHQRRRAMRQLDVTRISPDELRQRLASDDPPVVVDLRHAIEHDARPESIPGALYIPLEDLDRRHQEIPRDKEIVLVCT